MLLNALQFSNCKKVGSERYTMEDSNINCDSDFFKNFILPVNIGVSVVLGIMVPIFIFIVLYMGNKQK